MQRSLLSVLGVMASCAIVMAQGPGVGKGGPPRPAFSVTSMAWPDGGEVPARNGGRGENKSPAFEFHWNLGVTPAAAPTELLSYAVLLHDLDNSSNKTTVDTLHWSAFNIPGTATGLPEGLGAGELPDGTRNGPGIGGRGGNPSAYIGPGSGPGAFHHYVFEFYALDTKINLPANTTREELMKAMDGHVIGKAAWFGRFHATP